MKAFDQMSIFAAAVFLSSVMAACGGGSTTSAPQKSDSTSAAAALPHGTVREDLTFTGDLSGRMESARHGNAYTCGGMGSIYIVDPILGTINGKNYELGIQISGFKGPGTYRAGGELTPGSGVAAVSIWLKPEGTETRSASKAGSVEVKPDRRSGTMDAELAGKLGSFHVQGAWTCPPDF
jgi:hypothetical protein